MPLRLRLEAVAETVQEFELAAAQKYQEGAALIAAGYEGAGIYLLGYSAEMLLKNAYFHYTGARPADLTQPRLGAALSAGRRYIPLISHEAYHSLRFWSLLLREVRRHEKRPLPPAVDAPFVSRTRRLYQNWWIGMRYHQEYSVSREAGSVYSDVTWLRDNYTALWR